MSTTSLVAPPLAVPWRFQAFTGEHALLLGLFAVGVLAVAWWGRRHRGSDGEVRARRSAAVLLALVALLVQGYQLTPEDFNLATSLPLALCDVATVSAVLALWFRNRYAAAFTYYVGLSLTTQGIVTPALAEAFPHPRYLGFWALHFLVVWSAVYLTWGLGIRPTWRTYTTSVAATAAWALSAYAFNVAAGTNYGYLNRKPASASVLDLLGPWPWYVLAEVVLVAGVWAVVMTLPWTLSARRSAPAAREGSRGSGAAPGASW